MKIQVVIWSVAYPEYEERMRAMNCPANVRLAIAQTVTLTLVPKD